MLGIDPAWGCYMVDTAIATFGVIVENALQERENIGSEEKPDYVSKYTLDQLLDPDFRIVTGKKLQKPLPARVDGLHISEVR